MLIVSVVLCAWSPGVAQPPAGDQPQFKRLTADELKAMIDGQEKMLLLDVREPQELEKLGALKGFVNIPLGQVGKRLGEVPKGTLIVSVCNRAVHAASAAGILHKNGHTQLRTFAMNDWTEKGYQVIYPKAEEKK